MFTFVSSLDAARGRRLVPFAFLGLSLVACGGGSASSGSATSSSSAPAAASSPVSASSTRDHMLTRTALGPWWGSGCPKSGECGCGDATNLAEEFTCQMNELRANDIPVSVYLFDGSGWSERNSKDEGMCTGEDCCSWNLGDGVIDRLAQEHVRALVHFWGGCHEPSQYARVRSQLGGNLFGFYLDDGASDQELKRVNDYMKSVAPGDFENIAKAYQSREPSISDAGLSASANATYVADLTNDFGGLREGIFRVLTKAKFLPSPFNELTAYDYDDPVAPEEETYFRRIHWGAFQPIMAHTPFANSDPWRSQYSSDLLYAYRYFAWLHKELTPYFMSYARRMHEQSTSPVMTQGPMPYSMLVGDEIFVPFVTDPTGSLDVKLPSGSWVEYWEEASVVSGSLPEYPAPLGREPIFIKLGAIIPMEVEREYTGHGTWESQGSLTVLVYPSGTSTFRYFDDDNGVWSTFRSALDGNRLTLTVDTAMRQPVLYRIGRVASKPSSVAINGRTVLVNQGGGLSEAESENEINGAPASAWFYDDRNQRLIVKVFP